MTPLDLMVGHEQFPKRKLRQSPSLQILPTRRSGPPDVDEDHFYNLGYEIHSSIMGMIQVPEIDSNGLLDGYSIDSGLRLLRIGLP
jgi:hypothetical protein